jgi:hypothetical protein
MQSVEKAIEESRAKKKAIIKKSLLGALVLIVVIAVGGFLVFMLPVTSTKSGILAMKMTRRPPLLLSRQAKKFLVKRSEKPYKLH